MKASTKEMVFVLSVLQFPDKQMTQRPRKCVT